jgi:hypothetical protein
VSDDRLKSQNQPDQIDPDDPLGSVEDLASQEVPTGVDRRTFLMRSALIGALVNIDNPEAQTPQAFRRLSDPIFIQV